MVKQCKLLEINRSSLYYKSKELTEEDEKLMRFIDQIYMKYPFKGSRKICFALRDIHGVHVSRGRVQRLMRIMGLRGLSPRPKTTRGAEGHKIYPYLLREEKIERANHVQIRCGQRTSRIYRCQRGFCTWQRLWTGIQEKC